MRSQIRTNRVRGASLIEIVVVVAIIGLLAAITIPTLRSARQTSRATACLARIGQCAAVASQYAMDFADQPPVVPASIDRSSGSARLPVRAVLRGDDKPVVDMEYFGQGRYWSWVVASEHRADVRDLTCPGIDQSLHDPVVWPGPPLPVIGGQQAPPSVYALVDGLLAQPALWTPGSTADLSKLRLQRWSSAAHPARKAAMFEGLIGHLPGGARRTIDQSPPRASIAFFDAHAAALDFSLATPPIAQPFALRTPRTLSDTPRGLQGADFE